MRKISWITVLPVLIACSLSAQQTPPLPIAGSQPDKPAVTAPAETPLPPFIDGIPTCGKESQPPQGTHRMGSGARPPKPRFTPVAEFSDEARKMIKKQHIKDFQAVSLLRLTVNEEGNPEDICIARPAGFSLDKQAFLAAQKYRFDPATQDGNPVAARITIEVNFKLY